MSIVDRLMADDSMPQRMDYGFDASIEVRPLQLMQLGAWLQRHGYDIDSDDGQAEELRDALMGGKLDVWIYGE